MNDRECCKDCHYRTRKAPREPQEKRQMQNRLSRIEGQIKGIMTMLEEDRYCGDILNQVVAAEKGLRAFGQELAKSHFYSCVAPDIAEGSDELANEFMVLFEQLSR
ncbi:MAG TPA: metal-sensing transcriptional repressor [Candidatus Acidoferrum sp.]|nr:metal-sensing transcriptional repressor [Candidatus Acidoferrum sp.]